MDWATVAIVAIVIWGGVKAYQAKHGIVSDEDGNEKLISSAEPYDDSATKAEIKQLKERVQVLERLVTDRSHILADEIEALRSTGSENGIPLDIKNQEKA